MRIWQGVLGLALLLLLPLAWMQYRWIGEISESELDRRRDSLAAATERMAVEFDRELARQVRARVEGQSEEEEAPTFVTAVTPVTQASDRHAAGWILLGPRGPIRVEVDLEVLRKEVFPALFTGTFGRRAAEEYAVRVMDLRRREQIYLSEGAAAETRWETIAPLFRMGMPGWRRNGGGRRGGEGPGFGRPRGLMLAPWRLEAAVREGSLAEAVERTRMRNLALSGVTLLLLTGSVVALALVARRAERLSRQQMEFAAGVTHELKTPLSVVCSAGDNLAGGFVTDPEQVKRYGALVRTEGQRLARMVEQILRFVGLQSGRVEFVRDPVDLRESIEKAAAELETPVEQVLPVPLPVAGEAMALQQVVRNLLENAVMHGKEGVTVRGAVEGREVVVRVEDSGPGIAAGELGRLFEPFYRGARTRSAQVKGFGLGLALVKRIVEGHGGRVTVENRRPRGAAFTVRLPLRSEG